MTTEAARAAKARYDAKTAKYYSLKLNTNTDSGLIQWLESMKDAKGIQGYLKRLIREDMKGETVMTKQFEQKVLKEGMVDTKAYRYIAKEINGADAQWIEIQRLPIVYLDTTESIDGWETVKVIK